MNPPECSDNPDMMEPLRTAVLLVDDEPLNLRYMHKLLDGHGKIYAASSAEEAMDILGNDCSIGVVVTDIRMPDHDGEWLAEQIHARWPYIQVMAVTAYGNVQKKGLFSDIFQKPIQIDKFLRRLTLRVLEVA